MERFECVHCGICCSDELIPINLTFQDLLRLSSAGSTVRELFEADVVGFSPFLNPENGRYDIEVGLRKPCSLRKENRCSVYEMRPLNCRLFPYWIFASIPQHLWGEVFDDQMGCRCRPDSIEGYKKYTKAVGDILLVESEETDMMLERLKQRLGIDTKGVWVGVPEREKQREQLMKARSIVEAMDLEKLKEEVINALGKMHLHSIDKLNKIEGELD